MVHRIKLMKKGIIYKATCLLNGKRYFGKTITGLSKRKNNHYASSFNAKDKSYNDHFHRAIRKHGKDNFTWEIVEADVPEDELNDLEIQYIAAANTYKSNEYNSTAGGEGGSEIRPSSYEVFTIYHEDGSVATGTREQLESRYGLLRHSLNHIINGSRYTLKGWAADKSRFHKRYSFEHEDGRRILDVRPVQFVTILGYSKNAANKLVSGKRKTYKGWKLIK